MTVAYALSLWTCDAGRAWSPGCRLPPTRRACDNRQTAIARPYMRVFGVSQPPYGFVQFCERVPEECRQGPQEEQRFSATPERLSRAPTPSTAP